MTHVCEATKAIESIIGKLDEEDAKALAASIDILLWSNDGEEIQKAKKESWARILHSKLNAH